MREILETSREVEYFNRLGLRTLTGLDERQWDSCIFKESIDNALDAINESECKEIHVSITNGLLTLIDSGSGLPENILDDIFSFTKYVSSKRDFRTPTRGFQGNALKTIIGICYLEGYELSFIVDGKQISYKPNEAQIKAGIVSFDKKIRSTSLEGGGVIINGVEFDIDKIKDSLWTYYLCNPDVNFKLAHNSLKPYGVIRWDAVVKPIKRTEKTYIHWYDLDAFNQLLQAVNHKDPCRTTKVFCQKFAGAQRIISQLSFPYKKLSDFAENEEEVDNLYNELKEKIKPPTPKILSGLISGKDILFRIYSESEEHRHKLIYGEYQYNEATVPYVIEGYLLYNEDVHSQSKVISSVNNSIPYESCPFDFSDTYNRLDFCKQSYPYIDSLRSLLDSCGFLVESQGLTLYLNFISPFIEFTDKAKTKIISGRFQTDLIKVVESLIKDVVKEIKRVRRKQKAFDRECAMVVKKKDSKTDLIRRHFMDAYDKASGDGQYLVTARQVFYVVREILNKDYDVEIKGSDYNTFTQDHVTKFFDVYPDLAEKILLERRGVFKEPFSNEEIPLGTKDVMQYKNLDYDNKIYQEQRTIYSIPPELKYNHVLFIEKQGFNSILEQSGLLKKLNLGIMSSQGFGTRAAKNLISWLIEKKIKVYVLHDCDIAGYLIQDKFTAGSETFKDRLDVFGIGLKLKDIDNLNKRHQAEVVHYGRPYNQSLDILTKEERDFFVVDKYSKQYRRVELNTLTAPELIEFIESKIKYKPIEPNTKQLKTFIDVNKTEIIKDALFQVYGSSLDIRIDKTVIANQIRKSVSSRVHWVDTLDSVVSDYIQEKTEEIKNKIINEYRN